MMMVAVDLRRCSTSSAMRFIVATASTGYWPGRALGRKHHGVRALEDGGRHVGYFRAGRHRRGDHRSRASASRPRPACPAGAPSRVMRFCRPGTFSSGISTPRSPRATISASEISMISSRRAIACGFSIFDMHERAPARRPCGPRPRPRGAARRTARPSRRRHPAPPRDRSGPSPSWRRPGFPCRAGYALAVGDPAGDLDRGRAPGLRDLEDAAAASCRRRCSTVWPGSSARRISGWGR